MNDKARKGILHMLDNDTLAVIDDAFAMMLDSIQDITANQISETAVPLRNILGLCECECRDDCHFNELYLNTKYKLCEVFVDIADCLDTRTIREDQVEAEFQEEEKDAANRIHEVKSWPEYFQPVLLGKKTWEYRINDRDYRVGDMLLMREWVNGDYIRADRETRFTGKWILAEITSVHGGLPGLAKGYCILNIFVHEIGTIRSEMNQTLDNLGDYHLVPNPVK